MALRAVGCFFVGSGQAGCGGSVAIFIILLYVQELAMVGFFEGWTITHIAVQFRTRSRHLKPHGTRLANYFSCISK